ncbi:hypothetical protein MNEG_6644 [Monoraphidium neglectum]|uniref:Uncharacterized protein n=1 Tax=Monoraphidium neglectum TaxID=145388 RepID=A0A0D2N5S2_9CHLO|nr:hypothetical protein MNEG_6644 [Monoraphidium neglectum]KIZ01316.1 hypothetical protein MNEG_6644 [Monoraphidium neglectum]|eukprot:XP_013900335.1 hypothetical protein MNEG_6644 [Monoraphidium neglectum]
MLPLSVALCQQPARCDGVKLSAVSCCVTHIDELPAQFRGCGVVYLSSNSLRSLEGADQFQGLRVLSAASNLIERADDVVALLNCPQLEVLTLEGNPLAQLPNYRARVLALLPRLLSLDGRAVTAEERARAAVAIQAEAACTAVMLSNACLVHKLAHASRLLQLHAELRRALFGAGARMGALMLPTAVEVDVLRLLRLWDYEGSLGDRERAAILGALQREVVRVHRQLARATAELKPGGGRLTALQSWDVAYSQVMLAQQRTITQLIESVNASQAAAQRTAHDLLAGAAADAQGRQDAAMAGHRLER